MAAVAACNFPHRDPLHAPGDSHRQPGLVNIGNQWFAPGKEATMGVPQLGRYARSSILMRYAYTNRLAAKVNANASDNPSVMIRVE